MKSILSRLEALEAQQGDPVTVYMNDGVSTYEMTLKEARESGLMLGRADGNSLLVASCSGGQRDVNIFLDFLVEQIDKEAAE